jgi:GntR family transcriptional regulator, transcriptional repressor for pyruvate dehydrogenase complex
MASFANIADWKRLLSAVGPVQSENLTELLVREMKGWFVQGLIKPGEKLPAEREMAAAFKVSRASLRQALKALQVMGLLDCRHGSGNYLAEAAGRILLQPVDLLLPLRGLSYADLFEARRAMEAEAAACAASRSSENELHKLNDLLEGMRLNLHDPPAYVRLDIAFHRQIAAASGNSIFLWFFDLVSKALTPEWLARAPKNGDIHRTYPEHCEIASALSRRDPEGARNSILKHLTLTIYSHETSSLELRGVVRKQGHP